jgi:flagellar hook-associated protein FlgK
VHNAGRGLKGLTNVTANTKISINYIDDALDIAEVDLYSIGQDFRPSNGVMTFEVQNETTGAVEQIDIGVSLIGDDKMSLEDFRDAVSQIDHLSSSIDTYGRLSIQSDEGYSFFISEDTSDLAAFLGLNNFFTGNAAGSIEVNEALVNDVELLAAGKTDAVGDNDNLNEMINTRSTDLGTGFTFFQTYQTFVSDVASEVNRISSLQTNQDRIVSDVAERRNSFSGVNLDEEAANLLRFQQSYQAAAEYISVQNRLLDLLFQAV